MLFGIKYEKDSMQNNVRIEIMTVEKLAKYLKLVSLPEYKLAQEDKPKVGNRGVLRKEKINVMAGPW